MADETKKEKVRVIQFQMATDAVTGGAFQVTTDVPGDASPAEIAKELAALREAGMIEMAASNRRRLQHAQIVERTLEERIKTRREQGKHIKNADIDDARCKANLELSKAEATCIADDTMLLQQAGEIGH